MGILIFVACKNSAEARKIAKALLKKRLIACANIFPVESHYLWKGGMEKANEAMLLMKTRKGLQKQAEKEIKKLHSYKLPVIEFFETRLNREAEKWVKGETK